MENASSVQPELRSMAARLASTEYVDPSSPLFEAKLDGLWFELQECLACAMTKEHARREGSKPVALPASPRAVRSAVGV